MSGYANIKKTQEYADAVRDFESRIHNKLNPVFIELAEMRGYIGKLEDRIKELEDRLEKVKL